MHLEETISTLRFATRMMNVMTNPVENIQDDPSVMNDSELLLE